MQYLTTRNQFKARAMHSIAREAQKLRLTEQSNLANAIANEVAKRFN